MNRYDASVAIIVAICTTILAISLIAFDAANKKACYEKADTVMECK